MRINGIKYKSNIIESNNKILTLTINYRYIQKYEWILQKFKKKYTFKWNVGNIKNLTISSSSSM